MSGGRRFVVGAGLGFLAAIVAGVVITSHPRETRSTSIAGAVLEAAGDPRRQTPLANADIAATTSDGASAETKSDASGGFHLTLTPEVKPDQPVTTIVRHPGYEPFNVTAPVQNRIFLARLTPLAVERSVRASLPETPIADLRVRYTVKTSATMNVGSFARTFEVRGPGGIPCAQAPCSPDGKWKALGGGASYDAGENNEFQEVRVSCIAGPCAFTSVERRTFLNIGRTMKVAVLNWADTATFLVEAEVTRRLVSDAVRYSIPVVFGDGMDFTLPGSAEGPSVEANVKGTDIVFPLGPALLLSWAVCTLQTDSEGAKLYRCDLKPGYRFR